MTASLEDFLNQNLNGKSNGTVPKVTREEAQKARRDLEQVFGKATTDALLQQMTGLPLSAIDKATGHSHGHECAKSIMNQIAPHIKVVISGLAHIAQDHPEKLYEAQQAVIDVLNIDVARSRAQVPDLCLCEGLGFTICACPNQAEVDLYRNGKPVAAIQALTKRSGLGLKAAHTSINFYLI